MKIFTSSFVDAALWCVYVGRAPLSTMGFLGILCTRPYAPALFPFVGVPLCIRFHPWLTQRVCAGQKRQRAESRKIWPITLSPIPPFFGCEEGPG